MNDAYLLPTREELILRDRAHEDAKALASYLKYQSDLLEDAVQIYTERMNIEADNDGKWQPLGTSLTSSRNDELLYRSEDDLQKIRLAGRRLVNFNPFAINCVNNGQSYIVGTGHVYRIKRKEGVTPDQLSDDLLTRCREIVSQFEKRNIWSQRQDETWMRGERDGDVFRRLFITDSDLSVRFVEPEQLRNPTNLNMEDSLYNTVQYGVRFKRIDSPSNNARSFVDYESPESYYVHPITSNTPLTANVGDDYDELKAFSPETRAGELQHIKFNVDLAAPRGVSTFWSIEEFLDRAVKNLRSMSTMIGMRASIAWIRKHAHANKATIQAYVANAADAAVTNTLTGKTLNYRQWRPGSVIDANSDTTYDFPPVTDPTGVVAGVQAELRAAASRVQYPEFMFTSDSSGANYSSVLVAEGPAVKKFEKCQQRMVEWDKPLLELQFALKAKAGELPRNILDLVDISVDTPRVKTRNLGEEVTAGIQQIEAGLASKAEIAGELGREHEKSKAAIEEEKKWEQEMAKKFPPPVPPGAPGAPPAKPAEPAAQEPPAKPTKTAPEIKEPDGGDVGEGQDLDEEQHTYSSLLAEVPLTISKAALAISQFIPAGDLAEKGREYLPHITVKYGFPFDDPAPVLQTLRGQAPITATLGTVSLFHSDPANPKPCDVVKVDVASPDLESLHQRLTATLPNVVTHAEYRPHLTLAYVKPGAGDKYDGMSPFAGTKITIDSLLFSDRAGTQIRIPLPPLEPPVQQVVLQEANPYHGPDGKFSTSPGGSVKTYKQGQSLSRQEVIDHVMSVNPPGRVAEGKMTPEEWADKYLSDEKEGYTVTKVHPDILRHPRGKDADKAEKFADMDPATSPPIVIDSNDKLQARAVYDEEGGYGLAPHIVIDGSHRGTAAMLRGDKEITAIVPKRLAKRLQAESLTAEKVDFARKYIHDKGYEVSEVQSRGQGGFDVVFKYDKETAEVRGTPTGVWSERTFDRIAEKASHTWQYAASEETQESFFPETPVGTVQESTPDLTKLEHLLESHPGGWEEIDGVPIYIEPLQEANPYHDHLGRFAEGSGGGKLAADKDSGSGAAGGKKKPLKKVQVGSDDYKALAPEAKEQVLRDEFKQKLPATPLTRYTSVKSKKYGRLNEGQQSLNRTIGKAEAIAAALAKQADRCEDPTQRRQLLHRALGCLRQADAAYKALTQSQKRGKK